MRLIDGDRITRLFNDILSLEQDSDDRAFFRGTEACNAIIENAPTVEAIPIEWLEQIAEKISPATIEIDIPHNLLVFTSKRFVEVLTELWRRHFTADQIADGEWIRRQTDEDN